MHYGILFNALLFLGWCFMIRNYFENCRSEIIESIKKLVEIPSVRGEAEENAPFGKYCAEALNTVKKMYEDSGFETELYEKDGYLLSYYRGGDKKRIGMFAHSDVVPAGNDWIYTEPFKMLEKEGFLFGRGVEDNISGIVMSLFTARAIRDLKLPFDSTLVLFTGSNEETGMKDILAYNKKHETPDLSLVPDMAFPVCRGEAGICHLWAESQKIEGCLENIEGGDAFNIILGNAKAILKYDANIYDNLCGKKSENVTIMHKDDKIVIESKGASKHVCTPEGSQNAAYFIFELLSSCEYIEDEQRTLFKNTAKLLETPFGDGMGIANEDADFGRMSCGNGMVRFEDGKIRLSFDIRYSASLSAKDIEDGVYSALKKIGWKMELVSNREGYIYSASDPFVVAMEEAYRKCTGNSDAHAFVTKGGTYAREVKNALGVGTECLKERPFDFENGHGGVHQADECISVDGLLDAMSVVTEMIIACDRLN